ncbi:MAG: endonuclease/exonuclease/phosphatase family protein [Myxococcota bacterium]
MNVLFLLLGCTGSGATDSADTAIVDGSATIRFAIYNAAMFRDGAGDLAAELSGPNSPQGKQIAAVIQTVRPDVLLLQELDNVPGEDALSAFQDNYLEVDQGDSAAITYPYAWAAPSNTGVATDFDLDNNDERTGTGGDAQGFGLFEGQYAFAILSMYPFDQDEIRTFQNFLWKDMPDPLLPGGWFSEEELAIQRLSSKNHIDVPIETPDGVIHVLGSHPTPPGFDGAEDRNGKRNHDEIRLWADYLSGVDYLVDDGGVSGGLAEGERFVVMGDLNADPFDGSNIPGTIFQLLEHPRVNASQIPKSDGGAANDVDPSHQGDNAADTAVWGLRVDYALPSINLTVADAQVFWPAPGESGSGLVEGSDHRLVWVDVVIPDE